MIAGFTSEASSTLDGFGSNEPCSMNRSNIGKGLQLHLKGVGKRDLLSMRKKNTGSVVRTIRKAQGQQVAWKEREWEVL
jgi:hypothetical protein